jgi:hypothetical protein
MLWTIFPVLLIAWALELVSGYRLGNFVHVLLVIAPFVLLFQLLSGRRSTPWGDSPVEPVAAGPEGAPARSSYTYDSERQRGVMNQFVVGVVFLGLLGSGVLVGCEKGPAEKVGEKIDKALDKLSGKGPLEKAGERIDKAVEEIKKN